MKKVLHTSKSSVRKRAEIERDKFFEQAVKAWLENPLTKKELEDFPKTKLCGTFDLMDENHNRR